MLNTDIYDQKNGKTACAGPKKRRFHISRAFHFHLESVEMLSVLAAKRMMKGAATFTSFALGLCQ